MDSEEIKKIKKQDEKIAEYKFLKLEDAHQFFGDKLIKRAKECLAAIETGQAVYWEE